MAQRIGGMRAQRRRRENGGGSNGGGARGGNGSGGGGAGAAASNIKMKNGFGVTAMKKTSGSERQRIDGNGEG